MQGLLAQGSAMDEDKGRKENKKQNISRRVQQHRRREERIKCPKIIMTF